MKTQQAIKHFGSVRALAQALGVSTQAVYAWWTTPPKRVQYEIQVKTNNALKASS